MLWCASLIPIPLGVRVRNPEISPIMGNLYWGTAWFFWRCCTCSYSHAFPPWKQKNVSSLSSFPLSSFNGWMQPPFPLRHLLLPIKNWPPGPARCTKKFFRWRGVWFCFLGDEQGESVSFLPRPRRLILFGDVAGFWQTLLAFLLLDNLGMVRFYGFFDFVLLFEFCCCYSFCTLQIWKIWDVQMINELTFMSKSELPSFQFLVQVKKFLNPYGLQKCKTIPIIP